MAEAETQVQEPVQETTPEPVAQAPAPVAPVVPIQPKEMLGQVTQRQEVVMESDTLGKRFEAARNAIKGDEMLSASEKEMKLLELDVMEEQRQERRHTSARSAEDTTRDGYARQYKSTRETVDSNWDEAVAESVRRLGQFDRGAAMILFQDKMASKKPAGEPTPITEKKPVGQTRTEPRGARPAPAVPEKRLTVQEMMDRAAMGDSSFIPADVLAEARR